LTDERATSFLRSRAQGGDCAVSVDAAVFLLPFGFVLKISLSHTVMAQPPYLPVFDPAEGIGALKAAIAALSSENFKLLASDHFYVLSYLRSRLR
jgi:putrescine transport system permease protein